MSRAVPDYPSFHFQSGYVVRVRLLGPQTQANVYLKVQEDFADRKPTPPTEEINGVRQENDAHPDYLTALKAFENTVNIEVATRLMRLLANYALVKDFDDSDVLAYKDAMNAIGTPVGDDESNDYIYLWHLCATSKDEIQAFMQFALNQGRPSAERTAAYRQSFRGDVQRPEYLVGERTEVGPQS